MLQKLKNTIKEIGIMSIGLTLAFVIFIGLSISNAWTEPVVAPPAGNLAAPINVGIVAQDKAGQLGSTAGGAYGLGGLKIGKHTLNSHINGWLYVGNENGVVYDGKGLAANRLYAGTNVYAAAYCDQASNCKTIAQMGGGTTNVYSCPVLEQHCYGHYQAWQSGCSGQLQVGSTCTYGECGTVTANCTLIGKL